jgi:hypothetical protein
MPTAVAICIFGAAVDKPTNCVKKIIPVKKPSGKVMNASQDPILCDQEKMIKDEIQILKNIDMSESFL